MGQTMSLLCQSDEINYFGSIKYYLVVLKFNWAKKISLVQPKIKYEQNACEPIGMVHGLDQIQVHICPPETLCSNK